MADEVRLAFGLGLLAAVVAVAVFLARVLLTKDPLTFDPDRASGFSRTLGYLRMGLVAIGWFGVIALGLGAVFELFPWGTGESTWTIAGFLSLCTLPVLMALAQLPQKRHHLAALTEAALWERKQLQSTVTPSCEEVDALLTESRDTGKSSLERSIAASKHGFASELRQRDQRFEASILNRLGWAECAKQERAAQELATAEKAAAATAARIAKRARLEHIDQQLQARIQTVPTLDSSDAEIPLSEVVLSKRLTQDLWAKFKRHVAEPVPLSPEAAVEAARAFSSRLAALEGVRIAPGFAPAAIYSRHNRDGFCDIVMRNGEQTVSLYLGLRFNETVQGMTAALFFAAELPRHWSWGHGLYDRDSELIIEADRFRSLLHDEFHGKELGGLKKLPSPGIRLCRIEGGCEVRCVAARPGRGLQEVSLRVRDGESSPLQATDVFTWGRGIFY